MTTGGIYIHVPFCRSKCHYCSFYSVVSSDKLVELYFDNLVKEMNIAAKKFPLQASTLYFGGGTPSLLSSDQINRIIDVANDCFGLKKDAEITVEANPETVSLSNAQHWQQAGVNRVSIGVQATGQRLLNILGRRHSAQQADEAVNRVLQAGIKNINVDLMYGLPAQQPEDWEQTLQFCLDWPVTHISAYPLQVEENTRMKEMIDAGLVTINDDSIIEMMLMTPKILEKKGFRHYEISNFSQEGYICQHNLVYWQLVPYLGLGPAAASYYAGIRWSNDVDLDMWSKNIMDQRANIDYDSQKNEIRMAEFCFLSLRLLQNGISKAEFKNKFGLAVDSIYHQQLQELSMAGWIVDKGDRICLTEIAIPWANQIFMMFLPENE